MIWMFELIIAYKPEYQCSYANWCMQDVVCNSGHNGLKWMLIRTGVAPRLKVWDHRFDKRCGLASFYFHQYFFFSAMPVAEEESDPRSPSKRHSDNSCFFTSAVLFVCVLDICPIALCHLLQLLLIESLLPLLFLCSLTFIQWTENTLILVCYWSDNPEVWACLTELRAQFAVRRQIHTRSSLRLFLTLLNIFNVNGTFGWISVHRN